MNGRDAIRLAVAALRGSILRTLLTVLGMGVGVGAVLTVLELGDAGEIRVEDEIAKLGVNKIWIRPRNERHTLNSQDAQNLFSTTGAPACAGAYAVSYVMMNNTGVTAQVAGFDAAMQEVHNPKLLAGRCFSAAEFQQGSAVCLADEAFTGNFTNDVVGMYVTIGSRRLRIVGVIKNMTTQTMSGAAGLLVMPLNTFHDTFAGEVAEITLSLQRGQSAQIVAAQAQQLLSADDGFRADSLESEINAAREVVRIFVLVLVCVAGVCMLTGGIGIMNVLLLSVKERRREIALIKAIGGTARQVGVLFLLESMIYALIGGLTGVGLGALMTHTFGTWIGLEAEFRPVTILHVLGGAITLGVCVGVAPALKAAGLLPVKALNNE